MGTTVILSAVNALSQVRRGAASSRKRAERVCWFRNRVSSGRLQSIPFLYLLRSARAPRNGKCCCNRGTTIGYFLQALRAASQRIHRDDEEELAEAIGDSLMLVGKSVDIRRSLSSSVSTNNQEKLSWLRSPKTTTQDDERFLLPQVSALLVALRGTPGCIVVSAKAATLCIGVDGSRPRHEFEKDREEDEELIGLLDPPPALSTVCYDPTPRPLFKLDGASALRFASVRGLQLHVLAVLSSVEDSHHSSENVRLALLVSSNRQDRSRLQLIERDLSRLRKTEKKRAIALQRAEVEALRERLLREARVEPKRPPELKPLDQLPLPPPRTVTTATTDASLERFADDLDDRRDELPANADEAASAAASADADHAASVAKVAEENLVQAALAAYSSSLQQDEPQPSPSAKKPTDVKDLDLVRESIDSAMRTLLASIDGEDAALFGARLYDVMRQKTLSDKALTELPPSASIDLPISQDLYRRRSQPATLHESTVTKHLAPIPPQANFEAELPAEPETAESRAIVKQPSSHAQQAQNGFPVPLQVETDEEQQLSFPLHADAVYPPGIVEGETQDIPEIVEEQSSIVSEGDAGEVLLSPVQDELSSSSLMDAIPSHQDAARKAPHAEQNTRKRRFHGEETSQQERSETFSTSRSEIAVENSQRQSYEFDFVLSSLDPRNEESFASVSKLKESVIQQKTSDAESKEEVVTAPLRESVVETKTTTAFVDVETKDEELMFFGEDSVTLESLKNDPLLQALEQVVREERRLAEESGEPPLDDDDDDVLEAAAKIDLRSAAENFDAKSKTTTRTAAATKVRPTGWAATYDLASDGDVFATRTTDAPKPPQLQSRATALADRNAENLAKMQRFNDMRAKKARAMEERRRLEKEHRAALRAGAFQDDDENDADDLKAEIRRASTVTSTRRRRQTTAMPPARKLTNKRNITNALVQVCLAGPHCATSLADALAAVERSHADNHVILLKGDAVHSFLGIFALHRGRSATNSGGPYVDAEKIYGRGPRRFDESVITTFFKYNSASRAFQSLPSRSFTFTTDAVVVHPSHFKARHVPTY